MRLVVALLVLVVSTGTAVAQTAPPPPVAAPAESQPSPMEKVIGRMLSLDDAVAIALETQPTIQARLSDYAAARYRVDQAMSPLLPQVVGGWNIGRTQSASSVRTSTTPGGPLGNARTVTSIQDWRENTVASVSLSQLLFDFGKTFASTDAARRLSDVAFEDIELQRQLVTLTVKESFTNINFAQRLIRVQEQALERANLNLRSAQGFFQVGTRPKSDVTRAEVDVANARVDLIRARNAERNARVALNTAMGIPANTPTQIQDNLIYRDVALDSVQLLSVALRQRPESKQARLRVDQADALARRTVRDFFPDITGSGTYGATRSDMNEIWDITFALTWTLYDGGNRIARFKEAKANLDSAKSNVKATDLNISRDVEQAYINVTEANERIGAAQTAVASAQENFRLAQGRFDAGVGTILELTDAQLALTQAQNTEAQALADYQISLARLDRAVGRR
ncbi:MAG TPA: TolC family protein [Methylomirabilota bacterium]|jgi:outer membrane protein TolC|nr:TolC family protein [Methylomirabilota bacterium]